MSARPENEFLFELRQLELLGEVEIGLMHRSCRTPEKFLYLTIRRAEIVHDGIATSIAAHGASPAECIEHLYRRLIELPAEVMIVTEAWQPEKRRSFRYDAGLRSWVRVEEVSK
jgi:hypothetical protein